MSVDNIKPRLGHRPPQEPLPAPQELLPQEAKEFWADKGGSALVTKPSDLFKRQIYATFQGA